MKSTVDRRDQIIQIINKEGSVKVDELSSKFDVSTVTIRNDLEFLEAKRNHPPNLRRSPAAQQRV
ncbi:MAG: DeoR family transcriptional regulator [Balneolaceae bacterium]|nr:DeoR family transcriptional regulator [Balneolaceae bacterium]